MPLQVGFDSGRSLKACVERHYQRRHPNRVLVRLLECAVRMRQRYEAAALVRGKIAQPVHQKMPVLGFPKTCREIDAFGKRISAITEDRLMGRRKVARGPVERHAIEPACGADRFPLVRTHVAHCTPVHARSSTEKEFPHGREMDVADWNIAP